MYLGQKYYTVHPHESVWKEPIRHPGTAEAFRSLLQGWKVFFYVLFK